jgi:hypothetical protein
MVRRLLVLQSSKSQSIESPISCAVVPALSNRLFSTRDRITTSCRHGGGALRPFPTGPYLFLQTHATQKTTGVVRQRWSLATAPARRAPSPPGLPARSPTHRTRHRPRHDGDVKGAAPPPHPRTRSAAGADPDPHGARSAAADDRILAEFLETSLHVPNLTLPPQNRKRFQFPPPPPELPGVSAQALLPGESSAAAVIAAAESSGAFSVDTAVYASEVREAVEASKALFAAPEEVKRELER